MLINVENLIRRSIKRAAKCKFHRHHKLEAAEVFKTLEERFGKTDPLTSEKRTRTLKTC